MHNKLIPTLDEHFCFLFLGGKGGGGGGLETNTKENPKSAKHERASQRVQSTKGHPKVRITPTPQEDMNLNKVFQHLQELSSSEVTGLSTK